MTDPILSTASAGRASHFNQWVGVYIAFVLSAILAVASYGTSQFIQMRDSVRTLEDTVPLELQSINHRLDSLDSHQNTQDSRLYELEKAK